MGKNDSPLTARGMALGLAGLIVITASSMYVALRMGALPWPTVFVTVLSMAVLGKAKGSTLQEINCTHTLMSAGAMVSGGLAFTLPGLWMLDSSADIPLISIMAIAIAGAVLGTLFTIIFRRTFIEKERLPYPNGMAAYNTLIAGKEGKGAPILFSSLGASALFTFIRDGLGKIPAVLTLFKGSTMFPSLALWVSPMALGIGAIIGPVLSLTWFLGCCTLSAEIVALLTTMKSFLPVFDNRLVYYAAAFGLIILFAVINFFGRSLVKTVNNLSAAVKILTLLVFIIVGVFFVHGANYSPVIPAAALTGAGPFLKHFGAAFTPIFYLFTGFSFLLIAAKQMKNPEKNISRVLVAVMVSVTILDALMMLVAIGIFWSPLSWVFDSTSECVWYRNWEVGLLADYCRNAGQHLWGGLQRFV